MSHSVANAWLIIHCVSKTGLENLVITLSNVNRVAKFFGHYMQNEIGKRLMEKFHYTLNVQ